MTISNFATVLINDFSCEIIYTLRKMVRKSLQCTFLQDQKLFLPSTAGYENTDVCLYQF